jgi:hypothetical protein
LFHAVVVLPHIYITREFAPAHIIHKVSLRDIVLLKSSHGAVSWLSKCSTQNLLCVKYFIEVTQGILDPQILNAFVFMLGDSPACRWQKGGDRYMALYTIIRVYEVPAETKQQATERMLEALMFHVEKDFHVKDIIREPNEKPGQGKPVDLRPTGWLTLMIRQITGK